VGKKEGHNPGEWRMKKIKGKSAERDKGIPFWGTIYGFVKPQRKRLVFSAICAMVVGATVALQPITIKWIVDNGILRRLPDGTFAAPPDRFRYAIYFTGLFAALSLLRVTVGTIGVRFMIDGIEHFLRDLRSRFFRHVQHLCFRFHDQVSSGELFSYIMGSPLESLRSFLQQGAVTIPIQIVSWTVAIATLTTFNWIMSLVTLCTILVVCFVNKKSTLKVRELSAKFMETESSVSKYVADMLRGSRAVKIYAIEASVSHQFHDQADRMRVEGARLSKLRQLESVKAETIQYVGMTVIYATGVWLCLFRGMAVGTFFAFVGSIGILMQSVMTFMQLNLIRANAEAGLTRIVKVLQVEKSTREVQDAGAASMETQSRVAREKGQPCVEFKNVSFSYDDRSPVLRKISCKIPDGQSVALVGPSGSGKSTFISLLLRLYDAKEGEILLNGVNIAQYPLKDLRSSYGVVPQEPFIFQTTIKNNMRVTRPDATDEEIARAMEIAHVSEFVEKLPDTIHTMVGENGSNLSGGQKQRLAIARAVLAKPRYYIFDEATSALDNESEKKIQASMESLMRGHTTFVIAHRLSTIRNVDRVLVFDGGRIVQDGTYAELAASSGVFQSLVKSMGGL
jgi:ABC-type multidrug transport system fused ATPase/permease subunit